MGLCCHNQILFCASLASRGVASTRTAEDESTKQCMDPYSFDAGVCSVIPKSVLSCVHEYHGAWAHLIGCQIAPARDPKQRVCV